MRTPHNIDRLTRALALLVFALLLLVSPAPAEEVAANAPAGAEETAVRVPTKDLLSIVGGAGPMMIPLAVCSLLLLTFVFERFISLRRGRVIPKPFVKRFMQQMHLGELNREKALELCAESNSPVARVFSGALRKWGRPAVEVEQGIIDAGERVTNELRRYLRVLNGVATISPLLGLLGTVVGMIRAFNAIATSDALGRPQLLASGISEALLTTAGGLSVAIPALIFFLFFTSRVDRLVIEIDNVGQELVNLISAEELEARPSVTQPNKTQQSKPSQTKTRDKTQRKAA